MTPAQFWAMPVGNGPRIPMVGDADGDGHADLISLSVGSDAIWIARTSPLEKPQRPRQTGTGSGSARAADIIAAACGSFTRASSGSTIRGKCDELS